MQTPDSSALERVAALSRQLAITSFASLPQGATAASPSPGANQPMLASETDTDVSPAASAASTEPTVIVQSRGMMQTPGGYIATASLNGLAPGSYVIVHSDGTVSANSPQGNVLWHRASFEFTQWTGRYPTSSTGTPTPSTPIVALGLDTIQPVTSPLNTICPWRLKWRGVEKSPWHTISGPWARSMLQNGNRASAAHR